MKEVDQVLASLASSENDGRPVHLTSIQERLAQRNNRHWWALVYAVGAVLTAILAIAEAVSWLVVEPHIRRRRRARFLEEERNNRPEDDDGPTPVPTPQPLLRGAKLNHRTRVRDSVLVNSRAALATLEAIVRSAARSGTLVRASPPTRPRNIERRGEDMPMEPLPVYRAKATATADPCTACELYPRNFSCPNVEPVAAHAAEPREEGNPFLGQAEPANQRSRLQGENQYDRVRT